MKTMKQLLKYAKPFRINFILSLVSAFVGIGLSLLVPVLIGQGVDCAVGVDQVDFARLKTVCTELLAVVLISAFFQWVMSFCSNKLSYKTVELLRNDVMKKINRLGLPTIDSTPQGDIVNSVTTDIDVLSTGVLQGFTQVISGIVTILGTLIIMFVINPYIALVVVLLTPISLFMASYIAKHAHRKFAQQAKLRGELTGFAMEKIDGSQVVRAFNYQEKSISKFKKLNADWQKVGITAHFYSALTNPLTRFVNSLVYAAVAVFGGVFTVNGVITVGALASFLSYCSQYTKPFNEISAVIAEFQNAISSAQRVFDLLDKEEEQSDRDYPELQAENGEVDIQNIDFSYVPEKPFIQNLSIKVDSGKTVALVGPTGCGKTTLINLLMRFYDVNSGRILVDGKDIKTVTRDSLRAQFGMVLQDTWLFTGTIFDNIAYGKENATKEEVIEAAEKAYAHSFIKRLPKGYDTMVSGNGDNLSQGQKQLISIARVMLNDPPMLILDEATSNIDTRTEVKIQKAFATLMEGRTSFIVAHRLSTIKNADTILVMKDGAIIESGTHDELIEKGGFYSDLYNSQFAVY